MKLFSFDVASMEEFQKKLMVLNEEKDFQRAKSVLFQIFTAHRAETFIDGLRKAVLQLLPTAEIIGASSSGEIIDNKIFEHTTAVGVLCFDKSIVHTIGFECDHGREQESGRKLMKFVADLPDVKGVELLSDVKRIDNRSLVEEMNPLPGSILIFGGGADAYNNSSNTVVFDSTSTYSEGMVAAVFCGKDLQITGRVGLGWKRLGKRFKVTETDRFGTLLKTVDTLPATEVYQKYLKIGNDKNFHDDVGVFPIILNRNNRDLARVPISCTKDGAIVLGADVKTGEFFQIGYADPEALMSSSLHTAKEIAQFDPQALLFFTCITRKVYLKEYAICDFIPFGALAPACGFYTYGEIFRYDDHTETLNGSLICVAMREGDARQSEKQIDESHLNSVQGHMSLVQRLVRFVEVTTSDLEAANRQLDFLASHDMLTKLLNRGEIELRLKNEIQRVRRGNDVASIIMLDIDDFKNVNDTHGHAVGDEVLIKTTTVIINSVREYDYVGRWGGEEFLIVLPGTEVDEAASVAERLRVNICNYDFGSAGHITCSFGVSAIRAEDEATNLFIRVDEALYTAKKSGKNRVMIS